MERWASRWWLGLVLALACPIGGVWAEAAAPFIRVAQVVARGTHLTAYLDLRDSDGRVLVGIGAAQLHDTLGPHPAAVEELLPVATTGEGIA